MRITLVINTYKKHLKYFNKCVSSIPKDKNIQVFVVIDEKEIKYKILIKKILIKNSFENFKIFLNSQKGISSSRNKAIKMCKTRWITFIDGDDSISNFEINYKYFSKNYDFMIFNTRLSNRSKTKFYMNNSDIINNSQKINLIKKYLNYPRANSLVNHVWSKIYNTKFLKKNKINFKNIKVNEDFLFNSICFKKAKKIRIFKNHKLILHNVSSLRKTRDRHLNLHAKSYIEPLKNLSSIIPLKDRKIYLKRSIKYWEKKLEFLSRIN